MRKIVIAAGWLCGLAACQTPFGFGGEDWGGDVDDTNVLDDAEDTTNGALDTAPEYDGRAFPEVLAAHAFCAEGLPEGLAATVDPGGDVWFTHVGFADECSACADWVVYAALPGEDATLDVTYSDVDSATCDCDCAVQGIEFVIVGFEAGDWSLSAGDDTVAFSVPAADTAE